MLATDAYGGTGGIALYNRDVIESLCLDPDVAEVVVLPRVAPNPLEPMPDKLNFDTSALGGTRAYLAALLRHVRKGGFDLVYCAHVNLAPLAWAAAKLLRRPWLMLMFGVEVWKPIRRHRNSHFAKRADYYVALSGVTLERFRSWSGIPADKACVVYNAVRIDQFGEAPRNQALARRLRVEGKRVLLTLGRLHPLERAKGFDEMLELLPRLLRRAPDLVYVIAGEGGDRERLEEKARSLGVTEHVRFAGFIEESEKADLYRLAEVYVMPSHIEGFGFVFIEALACGVPVIASKIDGGREAVRGGMLGQIVDPDSPDEIEEAVFKALDSPRGVPDGLSYFSFENFVVRTQAACRTPLELPGGDASRRKGSAMEFGDKGTFAAPRAERQKNNERWWTDHTMSYDWNEPSKFEKFSLPWFDEIDARFLMGARLFNGTENPFVELMDLSNIAGKRVLEIGCGMGLHTEMMIRAGAQLTAVDLASTSVEATQRRLALKGLQGDVRQGDAEQPDFPPDHFDLVWAWGVIHHSARTAWIVRQIHDILRPGGEARLMIYNLEGMSAYVTMMRRYAFGFWRGRSLDEALWRESDGFTARHYTRDGWRDLLATFFATSELRVVGQDADVVPLPRQIRGPILRMISLEGQVARASARGSMLFSVSRKEG